MDVLVREQGGPFDPRCVQSLQRVLDVGPSRESPACVPGVVVAGQLA
jgi:hypothetical protein